jgi:Kae1-associated kinase Bud32
MQLAKGAEATIDKEDNVVRKSRITKNYRVKQIDEKLRKQRTRNEASLMRAARRVGIAVPRVINESDFVIEMEFVAGSKIKDVFEKDYKKLSERIAESIAKMHAHDIVHGDLTTSNMLLKDDEIYFIDFGLGSTSKRPEDKAVDLFLLHEAIESTHHTVLAEAWQIILNSYRKDYPEAESVVKALQKIEKRRRYTKKDW